MSTIAVIASPNTYIASLGAMVDAHGRLGEAYAANPALGDYARLHTRLRLVSAVRGAITLAGGRRMETDGDFAGLDDVRLIYLPSFQVPDPDRIQDSIRGMDTFHDWLKVQGAAGVVIGACGASVCHLAMAGLLADHHPALHPRLATAFKRLFPEVDIDPAGGISVSGNVMSCGPDARNAGLVVRLLGEAFSNVTAQSLALREPPGTPEPPFELAVDPVVAQAQLWIHERFARNFNISDLADELDISHQALIRRFRAAGLPTPRAFAQRIRIESAASMLVETSRSVTEIAQLIGYTDVASFRKVFVATTGKPPSAHRRGGKKTKKDVR